MADTLTPNAMLADDLEHWINGREGYEAAVVYKGLVHKAIAALRAPTIAAPSPSNEVIPPFRALSIILALCDKYTVRESTVEAVVPVAEIRDIIEAALKARKPADDGAGQ